MPLLKKLFWAYFLLLIFEGALRKWIVPGLSAPLLLIRDPLGLLILLEAFRTSKWPNKWSGIAGFLAVAMLLLCAVQIILLGNPWAAALYGVRSYLLPFPVAFVIGENLTAEDLRKFGRWTLWILLPMTALEVAQYMAPPGSFLNKGAYEGGGQLYYVAAHARASGTFSFVSGPTNYVPLAAAFILYGLLNERLTKQWLLWAATGATILSIPMIGARTVVFELIGVVACMGVAALLGVSQLFKVFKIAAPIAAVFLLVSLLPVFSRATASFTARFTEANQIEGGSAQRAVATRAFVPLQYQLEITDYTANPVGIGMGRGAAAISKLMTGEVSFITGEGELGRVMTELGPIPGIAFMLFRLILSVFLLVQALIEARKREPLALLLFPLTATSLLFSVCEQPTEQGFMVIAIAFTLAALKSSERRSLAVITRKPRQLPLRYSMRRPEQTGPDAGQSFA
ncbi:MAG: hypothetical protein WBP85_09425 [Terracidiphilus sp.]